jgi:hypothetical protein
MDDQREEAAIHELRELLIQEEDVPPESAAKVESVIGDEARRLATVTWTEATTLACLVLLLASPAAPMAVSLPVLGACLVASGIYAAGVRSVIRGGAHAAQEGT